LHLGQLSFGSGRPAKIADLKPLERACQMWGVPHSKVGDLKKALQFAGFCTR
jgi:hypothetical protein